MLTYPNRHSTSRVRIRNLILLLGATLSLAAAAGCISGEIADTGASVSTIQEGLSGCHGHASSSVPADGRFYLTTFGFTPADDGAMSCGQRTNHGSWYYAASRQRFGCGSRIRITNPQNGRCVVAETDDYGPDVCVENAAGRPIIDASPLVGQHLFGTRSAGWSDRFAIEVEQVSDSTPIGPCQGSSSPSSPPPSSPPPSPPPPSSTGDAADCHSATLDADVPDGTCVQSAADGAWYKCSDSAWVRGHSGCGTSFGWCTSATLGRDVPPRTCVQSASDGQWYQCAASGWEPGGADGSGPVGGCSSMHSL